AVRLYARDRQTRHRCQAAARQSGNAAAGQLSREAAGARQRHRRPSRASRPKSVQRAPALSIARHVSGKTAHARRSSGGQAIMLSSFKLRATGAATRQEWHGLSSNAPSPICAIALLAFVSFSTPRAVIATAAPAQQEVTRDFQKTLPLNAGQSFRIENKFGEVRVHGESSREVKISATIRVQSRSREEAEASSQKIQIDVLQTGESVLVRTVFPDEGKWLNLGKGTSYSVNYDIALPADAPLFVRNSFGSV